MPGWLASASPRPLPWLCGCLGGLFSLHPPSRVQFKGDGESERGQGEGHHGPEKAKAACGRDKAERQERSRVEAHRADDEEGAGAASVASHGPNLRGPLSRDNRLLTLSQVGGHSLGRLPAGLHSLLSEDPTMEGDVRLASHLSVLRRFFECPVLDGGNEGRP